MHVKTYLRREQQLCCSCSADPSPRTHGFSRARRKGNPSSISAFTHLYKTALITPHFAASCLLPPAIICLTPTRANVPQISPAPHGCDGRQGRKRSGLYFYHRRGSRPTVPGAPPTLQLCIFWTSSSSFQSPYFLYQVRILLPVSSTGTAAVRVRTSYG